MVEPKIKNNGRKIFVNEIFTKAERPIDDPEWMFAPQDGHTPVVETDYGGIEIATFTEKANQERHKHLISMEIYTVIEGSMTIRIEDNSDVVLQSGDEIVILPGAIHEVINKGIPFLTRVHVINCHGPRDKYIEENGVWCQVLTLKNQQSATNRT